MKKVLMIGMTKSRGGIETYIMNMFRNIGNEYEFFFPYLENIAYEDEIVKLGGKFIKGIPTSRRRPFEYYSKWLNVFKQYKFDAVYFNNCDIVNLDVLKIAKLSGVPVRIFHAHNSSKTLKNNKFFQIIEERNNRKNVGKIATNLLACSKNAGDYMFGDFSYEIIDNGIDISKFEYKEKVRNSKREELNLKDKKVVLFVGRFTNIKNPLFAIDVIKECHKLDESFCGLICGDGVLMGEAKERVSNENTGEFVRLLGNCSGVNELYSAADYLIMPSLFEGFPFVLVEAECSGLKCICSTNIETNTNIIGTVEYYPLDIGADGWAKRINAISLDKADREVCKSIIQKKGYDINLAIKTIERIIQGIK